MLARGREWNPMADDNLVDQQEIERLLNRDEGDADSAAEQAQAPSESEAAPPEAEAAGQAGTETASAEAPADKPAAVPGAQGDDKLLGQEDIEKLLHRAGAPSDASASPSRPSENAPNPASGEGDVPEADVQYLLSQAANALASINETDGAHLPQDAKAFRLEEFCGAPASTEVATFDLIRDVELDLKIELGRTHMYLEDVLRLRRGSVVPLDKLAGDPVDIYANGRLIARGEVLVLNDNFCVRVAELISGNNVTS